MEEPRRPNKIWERRGQRLCLSREYRNYLHSLTRFTEEDRRAFRELGVHLTEDSMERIEDPTGTAAFIEGGT